MVTVLYMAKVAVLVLCAEISQGFTIKQELVGVGYRAEAKGQILELSLGFSHDIHWVRY